MKDHRWEQVYRELSCFLRRGDTVLLPYGDWPELPCKSLFYDDIIDLGETTVLVLHKGRFGSIDKAVLRGIADTWQCIFGNEVFLCFSKEFRAPGDLRYGRRRIHYGVLGRFLRSRQLRRGTSRIWYIHLPKAAGTWMWQAFSRIYPSRIYFPSFAPFLAYPPTVEEYDLIGGHLPLSVVAPHLSPGDRVAGLMRQPTQRLLSAFLHSRRPTEDPSTFTATMQAMRDLPFREFLQTEGGRLEAQQQLIMLGCDHASGEASPDDQICLDRAKEMLSSDRFLFAPCTQSAAFYDIVAKPYRVRRRDSAKLNNSDHGAQSLDIEEFNNSLDLLQSINAAERQLYDFVAARFAAGG
ncbi:MAG TPA: hypothetical protein VGM07_04855 [Stellaceae bacterium]